MPTDRTQTRKASEVYAEVLLQAAQGPDAILALSEQLGQALGTIVGSIELRAALSDASLPAEARQQIAAEVFAGFDAALLAWLGVLIERGDLGLLPRINEAYLYAAEEALGAVIIDVTTVVPLDDQLRQQLKQKYAAQLGGEVILREHIDDSIVGGIVMSTHGRRIDASIVSQLQNARATLTQQQAG
ncbi:MAG: ATP synthase F1 subunit delta [Coriobacteriales bacterium]|jgi:F-type H+-transporting ATPase subunit delta|nr:ATP synthase F1 subunit delta [Coriobacteriales bacterium]